ncbi:hypothetical protein [Nocardia sp. NPDC052566]
MSTARVRAEQAAETERPDFEVVVIGAGFGGIGMGVELRRAPR